MASVVSIEVVYLRVGPILIQFSDIIEKYIFFHKRNVKIIMVYHNYVIMFFQLKNDFIEQYWAFK